MPLTEKQINAAFTRFIRDRDPSLRYASYDYCFNYFHSYKNKADLAVPANLEKSCLTLGFYLASWGMYRGSSFLLQRSATFYKPVIEYLAGACPAAAWSIDADKYNDANINLLLKVYSDLKALIPDGKSHLVLTTKIMLGVFGNTPAYDTYFKETFSKHYKRKPAFTVFNEDSLQAIAQFYKQNKKLIENFRQQCLTMNFSTGNPKKTYYTRAKIIDMIGFGHSALS